MATYTVQLLSSSEDEYIVRSSRNNLTMKRENQPEMTGRRIYTVSRDQT